MRRVNIFHEWLDTSGGAELVLKELVEIFPNATVYTLWAEPIFKKTLGVKIEVSFLQYFPSKIRRLVGLPLMPLAWKILSRNIEENDLSITSSWVFAHSAVPKRFEANSFHYVHTPARYWWNPEIDSRSKVKIPSFLFSLFRILDRYLAKNHLNVIANSQSTRERILQSWDLKSEVIHPPVDIEFFDFSKVHNLGERSNFLLCVGRFVPYKGHDLVIKLGEALSLPVVLIGHGKGEAHLRRLAAHAKIQISIEVDATRERIRELYSKCYCLVYPAIEDFGIVPVEAMASGALVLGIYKGGLRDSIEEGVTGSLVPSVDLEELLRGFQRLPSSDRMKIRSQSLRFSRNRFNLLVSEYLNEKDL